MQRITFVELCQHLTREVMSRRIRVYDDAHRALIARYAALPEHHKRVSLPAHLELCHSLRGRTCFANENYYVKWRPATLCAVGWCFTPAHDADAILTALGWLVVFGCRSLMPSPYATYLSDRVRMLADVDAHAVDKK